MQPGIAKGYENRETIMDNAIPLRYPSQPSEASGTTNGKVAEEGNIHFVLYGAGRNNGKASGIITQKIPLSVKRSPFELFKNEEHEIAENIEPKRHEKELEIQKDHDAKALQGLKALEEEFLEISNTPRSSLVNVEKKLKLLPRQHGSLQSTCAKLFELATVVQSSSHRFYLLRNRAKSIEPAFADTKRRKNQFLLDCEGRMKFANELWKGLGEGRKVANRKFLNHGGRIGTHFNLYKPDRGHARNKKPSYGEDGLLGKPSNQGAHHLPMYDSYHEIRDQSIQKLLAYMKKRKILRFKVNVLKHDRGIQGSTERAHHFCQKILASNGSDVQFPRFYSEHKSPSYHEPTVVVQSSEPESDELYATNVLVVGIHNNSKRYWTGHTTPAIKRATEKIRSGKYPEPFLLVVHNNASWEEKRRNNMSFGFGSVEGDLELQKLVLNKTIRGFKVVFSGCYPYETPIHTAKSSVISLIEGLESVSIPEVDAMVYQQLNTSACKAGDVALETSNVVLANASAAQRTFYEDPFIETLDAINSAWKTLTTEIVREQALWPSEHHNAQTSLCGVAQRMKERLHLPYPADLHVESPGEYLAAFSRDALSGSLAHTGLVGIRKHSDFVTSLTRLMPFFVKKRMGDCFETTLELSPSIASPSTDWRIVRRDLYTKNLSDAHIAPETAKLYRSRDDSIDIEPPLKRPRLQVYRICRVETLPLFAGPPTPT